MNTKQINYIKTAIVIVLLGLIYYPAFIWMWGRWNYEDTYYSHGLLIPLASFLFIWFKKKNLRELNCEPLNSGLFLIAAGLILHFAGIFIKFYFASAVSLLVLLSGIIIYFFGKRIYKQIFFPIVYLIFMIPMPLVLMSNIILRMKLFAAEIAAVVLNRIGIEAIRDGSIIKTARSYLEVEAPCSGLKSLIALLAFGAAFAYLTKNSLIKKWALFLSAFPIAIAANIMRIVLLGWVSEVYGMKAAQGWIHDFSGFLLFAVAALGMIIVDSLLANEGKYER